MKSKLMMIVPVAFLTCGVILVVADVALLRAMSNLAANGDVMASTWTPAEQRWLVLRAVVVAASVALVAIHCFRGWLQD